MTRKLAEATHERQLAEHGGPSGVRDRGLFESVLARPQQLAACGGSEVDAAALAAAYAFGLARSHSFIDGNKRTAYVVCRMFLVLNGWNLVGSLSDRYPVFLGLTEGRLNDSALTGWMRQHCRPEQVSEAAAGYSG